MSSERNLLNYNLKKYNSHQKEFGFATKLKKFYSTKTAAEFYNFLQQ